MEKPIILMLEETKQSIYQAINQSGLPDYMLLPIVKELYEALDKSTKASLEKAKNEYYSIAEASE